MLSTSVDRISERTRGQSKLCELKLHFSLWSPTSSKFYLQHFCLHGAILKELSNQCRSKKIGDDGETKETEPNTLQRQQNKGAKGWKKRRERDHARHTAQIISERQATSQWKNTSERRAAETPEERETRNGSSAIWHFEGGDEDVME